MKSASSKILLVTSEFPPGPGGIGDHAFNLTRILRSAGFQVRVLAEKRLEFEDDRNLEDWKGVTFVLERSSFKTIRYALLLVKMMMDERKQIIVATGSRSILMVGIVQLILQYKSMAILHGHELLMGGKISRWLIRHVLKRYSRLVAVSEFSKDIAMKYVYEKQIDMIPNGIDTGKFAIPTSQPARNWNGDSLNLLTVGRISPRKGQHNVVEALPVIRKQYPKVMYHMVGIPDHLEPVLERAKQLHVEDLIKVHGAVSNQELNAILAETDLFVMLSKNMTNGDVEGFGIAIIEANYFGKPAIGSIGCGIEQAIKHESTGWLVNPQEPTQILRAMQSILEKYDTYSNNAREWARDHDWNKVGEQYLNLLKRLLA